MPAKASAPPLSKQGGNLPTKKSGPPPNPSSFFGSGGNFFDPKSHTGSGPPPSTAQRPPPALRTFSNSSGFGDFSSGPPPITTATSRSRSTTGNGLDDLLDFSASSPLPPPKPPQQAQAVTSPFNLSNPAPAPPKSQPQPQISNSNRFSAMDNPWGSSDAWATSEPTPAPPVGPLAKLKSPTTWPKSPPVAAAVAPSLASDDFGGWNSATTGNGAGGAGGFGGPGGFDGVTAKPTVSADEDFGGWSSAAPQSPTPSRAAPSAAADDIWKNVWE